MRGASLAHALARDFRFTRNLLLESIKVGLVHIGLVTVALARHGLVQFALLTAWEVGGAALA
jgi:hypothetical protein